MKLWKVLGEDRWPCHGGNGQWPEPGEWLDVAGDLSPCVNGLHLCRREDLVVWLGPTIWEAEFDGEIVIAADKVVVRKARLVRQLDTWNKRSARLFACDCAEHVLPLFETKHPKDNRPRAAIEMARRFARGEATTAELVVARTAAKAAAWDTAWDAAGAAAWDTAWAAAKAAAGAAAWAAAWDTAWDAAGAAERSWQTDYLFTYLYPEQSHE